MAEIIDVLQVFEPACLQITVNTAVDFVVAVPASGFAELWATGARKYFKKGDNFQILSVGFSMPECFTLYKDPNELYQLPSFEFYPKGKVSNHYFSNVNIPSSILMPLENFEMSVDTFFECEKSIDNLDPTNNLLKEDFSLMLTMYDWKISMLNVPAVYNGKIFYIVPFIKVLHNEKLTSV
jgi:hypothetical protein